MFNLNFFAVIISPVMNMEPEGKLIGIRIMQKRKEAGLTQEQLSEEIGLSKNHLSGIERGKYLPTTQCIFKICSALGETPDYYLIGSIRDGNNRITGLFAQLPKSAQDLAIKFIEDYLQSI